MRRAGAASKRATTAGWSGGAAENCKITGENRFDSGRSEARSDYLIAGLRSQSTPSDSIEFGRNPYSKHCPHRTRTTAAPSTPLATSAQHNSKPQHNGVHAQCFLRATLFPPIMQQKKHGKQQGRQQGRQAKRFKIQTAQFRARPCPPDSAKPAQRQQRSKATSCSDALKLRVSASGDNHRSGLICRPA